ncbi:MAG TPA: ATP synthase F1 subunit epsilon [Fimbriimonas sp.]|nr:ATP synthase F1 subunit epsilon [Fimbriimonas sp.]
MAKEFHLSVVAPDRSVVEEAATSVIAPGSEGYFGVLVGHAPLIAALKPGMVEYADATGNRHFVYVGGGFAEVRGDRVTILADEAAPAREIDISEAEHRLEEARKALRGEPSSVTQENAVMEIDRAMSRIRAARAVR